ncbi:MAG: hypothetical protein UY23_C0003G0041 [Candidatus Jorgensenbacteria bacterium GW2011_GWA1_48_11]|uniref:Small ribosomal subunit protein bS6 n=1 Tax=Candidatus Jorgensenbacteria bacterium GW2011_GWA1_48_11 TaxID=1618660 RepID=A0A0G1WLJ7_9BACT|nr:MAG: hypothetical protein UY23_C0003G0041 [Candidatus Jorgensenbacteria bacterium GW2011_GWA1_48_11]KKW11881.1 MAG: hypothetical protein UY51_C0005G0122 [Candidatus Jorgensenbacteria bacterium GW2011_GWB1_49_9]HCQ93412.1 hypothetical protein [Candidatus Beckwithbacteria bacterium]
MNDTNNPERVGYNITFITEVEDSTALKKLLEKNGASVSNERPLQKIRLAYPIKKADFGFIGLLGFSLTPEAVPALEAALRLEAGLLRYSLTRVIIKASKKAEAAANYRAREEKRKPVFTKEPAKDFEPALTNEALEKKIEEILQ